MAAPHRPGRRAGRRRTGHAGLDAGRPTGGSADNRIERDVAGPVATTFSSVRIALATLPLRPMTLPMSFLGDMQLDDLGALASSCTSTLDPVRVIDEGAGDVGDELGSGHGVVFVTLPGRQDADLAEQPGDRLGRLRALGSATWRPSRHRRGWTRVPGAGRSDRAYPASVHHARCGRLRRRIGSSAASSRRRG